MKRLAALPLALWAAIAFGAEPGKSDAVAVAATLQPGKIHEECQHLEAGEKRRYHWKSSAPVDFNVHYHRDKEVFYPVKRSLMRGDGGTFTAKTAEDYCWMWSALDKAAKIEGEIR